MSAEVNVLEQPNRGRVAKRVAAKIEKTVAPQLEPGESVQAVLYAQKFISSYLMLVGYIGEAAYLLLSRPYYAVATDKRVLVFEATRMRGRLGGKVLDQELATVGIAELKKGRLRASFVLGSLVAGTRLKLRVGRAFYPDLDRLVALLQGS